MPSKIPFPNTKRNSTLAPGLSRYGRRAMYVRKGVWAIKKRNQAGPKKAEKPKAKVVQFGKKNESRTLQRPKIRIHFPSTPIHKGLHTKTASKGIGKIRSSITPGTVVILLNGSFAGKRVVCLKHLASGALLVAGPYKLNGVPLKKVDQRFVIATSTKLDISGVKVDHLNDDYFKKAAKPKQKKGEASFFAEKKAEKKTVAPAKVEAVKAIDAALTPIIKKVPNMEAYLRSSFHLCANDYPHEMKF